MYAIRSYYEGKGRNAVEEQMNDEVMEDLQEESDLKNEEVTKSSGKIMILTIICNW